MNRLLIGAADKTDLLLQLFAENFSGLFIDPTGLVAPALADCIPPDLTEHTCYLETNFGFNVLDVPDELKVTVVRSLVAVFDALYPSGENTLTRSNASFLLANAVRVLLDNNATLLDLNRLLSDKAYRSQCVRNCTDAFVRDNWATIEETDYRSAYAFLQAKIGDWFIDPTLRSILGHHSTFSLEKDKIVIVNLDRAKIGDITARLLGSLLIARSVGEVYIHDFGFFATEHFASMLPQERFTLSLNFLDELPPKLRQAVLGIEDKFVYRTNPKDAETLAFYVDAPNIAKIVDLAEDRVRTNYAETIKPEPPPNLKRLKAIRKRTRACHTRKL